MHLIGTFCIVNYIEPNQLLVVGTFNRNILYCKYASQFGASFQGLDLIGTFCIVNQAVSAAATFFQTI